MQEKYFAPVTKISYDCAGYRKGRNYGKVDLQDKTGNGDCGSDTGDRSYQSGNRRKRPGKNHSRNGDKSVRDNQKPDEQRNRFFEGDDVSPR